MPSQLSRGTTFVNGNSYGDVDFNNLVDAGTILPGAITEQTPGTPDDADNFLFVDSGTSTLQKCVFSDIIAAFPQGGANGVFALRKLGTTAGMAAAGDDARFPANLVGIRMAHSFAADTVATPDDIEFDSVILATSGSASINWALGNVFFSSLTGTLTLTHSGAVAGRRITVIIKTNGFTVNMPAPTLGTLQSSGNGTVGFQYTYTHTGGTGGITATRVLI